MMASVSPARITQFSRLQIPGFYGIVRFLSCWPRGPAASRTCALLLSVGLAVFLLVAPRGLVKLHVEQRCPAEDVMLVSSWPGLGSREGDVQRSVRPSCCSGPASAPGRAAHGHGGRSYETCVLLIQINSQ